MKTGKRSYPLDQLSVSEDGVSVSIHTHRQTIRLRVENDEWEWQMDMTFSQLVDFIRPHIAMHGERFKKSERSRSTGVEEGK